MNNTIYIANNQVTTDLKQADMNKVQLTTNTQVKVAPEVQQNQEAIQETGWMLVVLIIVLIVVAVLIGLYLNLKSQSDLPMSGLLTGHRKKVKPKQAASGNTNPINQNAAAPENTQPEENKLSVLDIFAEEDTNTSSEVKEEIPEDVPEQVQLDYVPEERAINEDTFDNEESSLKLCTPKSVEKCIKSFLEITKER